MAKQKENSAHNEKPSELELFLSKERERQTAILTDEFDLLCETLREDKSEYINLVSSKKEILLLLLTNYKVSTHPRWVSRCEEIFKAERKGWKEDEKMVKLLESLKKNKEVTSIEIMFNNRKDKSISITSKWNHEFIIEKLNELYLNKNLDLNRNWYNGKTSFKESCLQSTLDYLYQHLFEDGYNKYFFASFVEKPFTLNNKMAKLFVKIFACVDIHHDHQYYQKYLKKKYNGLMKL